MSGMAMERSVGEVVVPAAYTGERVTWVHHWTDTLFSFRCTRSAGFRFDAGQFAMIGLMVEGKPLVRAYSMVSAPWDEELEFLSVKVPDGPLTSRLQHVSVGDLVLIGRKATGTLRIQNLYPGGTLWMLSTGTGLAPFMSVIQDPATYERYERVVVTHTVRRVAELAYRDRILGMSTDEVLGEVVGDRLTYYPSVTREPFPVQKRITTLIEDGQVFRDLGVPELSPERDRVMLCGSEALNADCRVLLESRGFVEGSNGAQGSYVLEKAFVTK